MTVRLDVEPEVLDDVVGEQLVAHRQDAPARVVLVVGLEAHLDVLADAHLGNLSEPKRRQALLDSDALRIVHHGLGGDDHAGDGPKSHG